MNRLEEIVFCMFSPNEIWTYVLFFMVFVGIMRVVRDIGDEVKSNEITAAFFWMPCLIYVCVRVFRL